MPTQYGTPIEFTKDAFPPGSYIVGRTEIHRLESYEGEGQMLLSSWRTQTPEDIDPDNPDVTNRIHACPTLATRIDPKRIGANRKAAQQEATAAQMTSVLDEVAAELGTTPQTVDDLSKSCPSFAELEPAARAARMEAVLGILVKDRRAVAVDDGWVSPVSPVVDEADAEPAPEPEPEPEPKPTPAQRPTARGRRKAEAEPMPLPQAADEDLLVPLGRLLGIEFDGVVASAVITPTWLMKPLTDEVVDEGLAAIQFIAGHLIARRETSPAVTCPQLLADFLVELLWSLRDQRNARGE
jgi:hypothetical protein